MPAGARADRLSPTSAVRTSLAYQTPANSFSHSSAPTIVRDISLHGNMTASTLLLLLAALRLSLAVSSDATCYYPNGKANMELGAYVVCNTTADVSACCAPDDECTSNGFCRLKTAPDFGGYWRNLCTDQTWQSDSCPQYCLNATTAGAALSSCVTSIMTNANDSNR